jgi:hypothetical protein
MFPDDLAESERAMLHDLINLLLERLDTQRRLNEDLSRQLDAANQRLAVLDTFHYGIC